MSVSSESAEQMTKMLMDGTEVTLKVTGQASKELIVLLYAILKENKKTKGQTKLTNLLKSGKELEVFSIKKEQLQLFMNEAKRYGVLYTALVNKSNKDVDGMVDILVKSEDAAKINSIKSILIFLLIYIIGIALYDANKKNYRTKEEHGSAKWGLPYTLNSKYEQRPKDRNKILTQNVSLGLDSKKHQRNLNVLVIGGSGSGKTRSYVKPNILQANNSFVVLDCKGEILRDTGNLLKEKGYDIKILDLINMEKSYCYNPFVYLKNDNDVQKLVTNLFKSTTPKNTTSSDPFWAMQST